MKTMKKLTVILLCLVMLLSLGTAAFADDTSTGTVTDAAATETPETETDGTAAAEDTADASALTGYSILDSDALTKMVEDYASENGLKTSDLSVAYCYTATGDTWYYNGDTWMYAANMYRLPLMMLCAEKVASGEISMQKPISGTSMENAMKLVLVNSDVDTTNDIREYLGGNEVWRANAQKYSSITDYSDDYLAYNYVTSRYMLDVIGTLYNNPDQFPGILDNLKLAQAGSYISKNLAAYEVEQIAGSWTEQNSRVDCNAVAIVNTPNPFLLCVMTRNMGTGDGKIADLASLFTEYTLTLDDGLQDFLVARAEAEAQAAEAAKAAEEAAAKAAEEAASATPVPEAAADSSTTAEKSGSGKLTGGIIVVVIIAVVAGGAVYFLKKRGILGEVEDDEPEDGESEETEGTETKRTAALPRLNLTKAHGAHSGRHTAYAEPEEEPEEDISEETDAEEEPEEKMTALPRMNFARMFGTAAHSGRHSVHTEPETDEEPSETEEIPEVEASVEEPEKPVRRTARRGSHLRTSAPAEAEETVPAAEPKAAPAEEPEETFSIDDILNEVENGGLE